ncbi:hypothetical protein B0H13DRAFT_1627550 [Mycena leptocephala]|nr:hypothetical protein B0H13DRAFT_1627550 [Mycena leptocephala]
MLSSVLIIGALLIGGTDAANNWNVPCVTGSCSYDLPITNNSASGTMKIWGSTDAITDVTSAAGWQIIDCDSTALSQDIRLVCTTGSDSDPNSLCSHLYQNIGAVNKLVRLPEDCGASPFARIYKSWIPADQSMPAHVRRMLRRDGPAPVVKALSIDTNFDQVDYSKTGIVNIAIQGANVPGAPTDMEVPTGSRRRSGARRRGFGDFVKGSLNCAAKTAVTKVAAAAKVATADAEAAAKSIASNTIDINKSIDLQPLTLDKKITLFDKSIECGPVSASLNVDMDANANAQITLSVAAAGTIVPPKITSFGAVAGMTADVSGTVTMTADATGSLSTGKITLLNLGIPGLDIPGILTIGPSFQVATELDGEVDVSMDMTVGINFNVNDAQLAFPPSDSNKPLASAFSIGDTPLTLNAAPDVKATGKVTAHLIPSLDLGISALGGKAEAQVSLALDTNAALTLSLEGSASASLTKNIPIAGKDSATKASVKPPTFGGCVGVDANINVNVGADASFFGLFDALNTEKVLFNKDFEIFKVLFLGVKHSIS